MTKFTKLEQIVRLQYFFGYTDTEGSYMVLLLSDMASGPMLVGLSPFRMSAMHTLPKYYVFFRLQRSLRVLHWWQWEVNPILEGNYPYF